MLGLVAWTECVGDAGLSGYGGDVRSSEEEEELESGNLG